MTFHVTRAEMTRAFKSHFQFVTENQRNEKTDEPFDHQGRTSLLMLIYAVECGLKALLMIKQSCESTKNGTIPLHHHLLQGYEELGIPGDICKPMPTFRFTKDGAGENSAGDSKYHEVCRYGATPPPEQVLKVKTTLLKMANWIEERLP